MPEQYRPKIVDYIEVRATQLQKSFVWQHQHIYNFAYAECIKAIKDSGYPPESVYEIEHDFRFNHDNLVHFCLMFACNAAKSGGLRSLLAEREVVHNQNLRRVFAETREEYLNLLDKINCYSTDADIFYQRHELPLLVLAFNFLYGVDKKVLYKQIEAELDLFNECSLFW